MKKHHLEGAVFIIYHPSAFFLRFYLFIGHRERERERERLQVSREAGKQGGKQASF